MRYIRISKNRDKQRAGCKVVTWAENAHFFSKFVLLYVLRNSLMYEKKRWPWPGLCGPDVETRRRWRRDIDVTVMKLG